MQVAESEHLEEEVLEGVWYGLTCKSQSLNISKKSFMSIMPVPCTSMIFSTHSRSISRSGGGEVGVGGWGLGGRGSGGG